MPYARKGIGFLHKYHDGSSYTACGRKLSLMKKIPVAKIWKYVGRPRCPRCWS